MARVYGLCVIEPSMPEVPAQLLGYRAGWSFGSARRRRQGKGAEPPMLIGMNDALSPTPSRQLRGFPPQPAAPGNGRRLMLQNGRDPPPPQVLASGRSREVVNNHQVVAISL